MNQVVKKTIWSALGAVAMTVMLGQSAAYADRDDRRQRDRDRGPRQEQRWDNHRHDGRGGQWNQQRHDDRRHWQAQQRPVIVQHNVQYRFSDHDRTHLQRNYGRSLRALRVDHRPYFQPGYAMLPAYRPYITPVPVNVLHTLPPPPPGYVIGYYQGYNVVYDPATYVVLAAIDLLVR